MEWRLDRMPTITQPAFFEILQTSTGAMELFPTVWSAAESLADPDAPTRRAGLAQLIELNAPRLSALVAYLIATRISDPDLEMRHQVVLVLGDLLVIDKEGHAADESVRQVITTYLSQMRTRTVFSLLQVAEKYPDADVQFTRLFNACPYAGEHLVEILSDRNNTLSVRKKAIDLVGLVGYLDAIPALERLEARLQTRLIGQQAMPFAQSASLDESELLPAIQGAINSLRAP